MYFSKQTDIAFNLREWNGSEISSITIGTPAKYLVAFLQLLSGHLLYIVCLLYLITLDLSTKNGCILMHHCATSR